MGTQKGINNSQNRAAMVIEGMIHTRVPIVDVGHSINLLACHQRLQVVG